MPTQHVYLTLLKRLILQDETLTEAEYEKYEEMCASQIEDLFAEEDVKLPRLRSEKSSLEAEVAALQQELLECQEREKVFSKQYNILSGNSFCQRV